MPAAKHKHALSDEQQIALTKSINRFWTWLGVNLPTSKLKHYATILFPNPKRDDWIMWVKDAGAGEVQFNSYVTSKCTFQYFEMIVIHECFHLFVQDLPNKHDAKLLKHGFGDVMMKFLDIEADYFTALYYKQEKDASLVDVFSLYAEGSRVFGDPIVFTSKLERFIGSVLSIANLYFTHPGNTTVYEPDLYLPSIQNIPTDEVLHLIVSQNSHFVLGKISASFQDLVEIKRAYTHTGQFTTKGYVDLLLRFSSKALGKPIPRKIARQCGSLR